MALKHLLDLNKTDRYTADGREEIAKLQAEVTEDVKYKTGDISQKTGLQKQPDGSWAPPKKGGKPAEGTLKPSRKPDQKKHPLIKNPDVLGMTANGARKRMEAFGAQFVENKNGKDYFKTTSGDLVEVEYGDNKKVLSSTTYTGGEKPEQVYPTTAGHNIESYINKLHEEGWKNDGWERNSANGALGYFKKGDKTIRVMQNWNGTLGGVTEIKPKAESKPATRKSVDKEKLLDALSFDLVDTTADIEEEYNAIEHSDNSRLPEFVRQEIERDYVNKTNGEKWTDEEKDIIAEEVTRRIKQRQSKDSAPRELTGDCKIKIRQTQDKVYQIGEISQKTGLQKTANGWRPPQETKFGKVKQNKEGQWGVQVKQGKGSDFLKHKSEAEAKRALSNYTAGYNTTERSKEDPHSDKARQAKQWRKEDEKAAKARRAEGRAAHAAQFQKEEKPAAKKPEGVNEDGSIRIPKEGMNVLVKVNGNRPGKIVDYRGDYVTVEMPPRGNYPGRRDVYYKSDLKFDEEMKADALERSAAEDAAPKIRELTGDCKIRVRK